MKPTPLELDLESFPVCPICSATLRLYEKERMDSTIKERIGFACGGEHIRTRTASFKHEFPDGSLTPYGMPGKWGRNEACGNAEEVVRQLRVEALDKKTKA